VRKVNYGYCELYRPSSVTDYWGGWWFGAAP